MVCFSMIMTAAGGMQRGVGLVVQDRPQGLSIESTLFHMPNVGSCNIFAGGHFTSLIGAYLLPSILYHLPDLKEDLTRFQDQDPIVLRYHYANIVQDHNPCSQQVADLMMEYGLVDIFHNF